MNRTKILKHVVNILAVVLLSAIAFLFTAYAFTYKNVDFIAVHFDAMVVLAGAVAAVFGLYARIYRHMRDYLFCALCQRVDCKDKQC